MSLKNKFCPKCGHEAKELNNGLCAKCYYQDNQIRVPKEIVLTICKKCNSILSKGKWIKTDSWKLYLTEELTKRIKLPKEVILDNIKVVETGEEGKVRLWLAINDEVFTESRRISIIVREKMCSTCNIKKSKQWNSKIQLRTDDKLIKKILKLLPKKYVIRIKPVTNGVDIYFSDKDKGKSFAKKVKSNYNLKSKSSFEQRGWDRLKNTSHKLPVILLKSD
ncbi:MAG: hypothetical protein JSW73_01055 [Candidatus Woesearchaeota archaeon]|nr:MAG: hypothetical protein JSW73_01055 [Candidatus Woesearchaeota archaeon]